MPRPDSRQQKQNYAYRLLAAKYTILRMRAGRAIKAWANRVRARSARSWIFSGARQDGPAKRMFVLSAVVLGLASLAFAGRWFVTNNALTNQLTVAALKTDPDTTYSQLSSAEYVQKPQQVVVDASYSQVETEAGSKSLQQKLQADLGKALKAERISRTKAEALQVTVDNLQEQIRALENETLALESLLLNKEVALAKADKEKGKAKVEHRVVYNITNIPVGSHVPDTENDLAIDSVAAFDDQTSPYQSGMQGPYLPDIQDPDQAGVPEPYQAELAAPYLPEPQDPYLAELQDPYPADFRDPYLADFQDPYQTDLQNQYESEYQFGYQPNSELDYDQYMQTDGEVQQWQGDQYLADVMERNAQTLLDGYTGDPAAAALDYTSEFPLPRDQTVPGNQQQGGFFGPAPDRYEDLIDPGFAETPYTQQTRDQ